MEALLQKKEILLKEYNQALTNYELKKKELQNIEEKIISCCCDQGHEWIRETETCMYGETFMVCKKCGVLY